MSEHQVAFVGAIPENYDRYLGPCLFEPYAVDIVQRVRVSEGASVLEIACGTGIVTRHLRESLPKGARLVATDLNQAMLDRAAGQFGSGDSIEWKQADATSLPFADNSFDAVVCQFALMFFPDKLAALREIHRVLVADGSLVFNVWDSIDKNELPLIAHEVISSFFEQDPPNFYRVPFTLYDQTLVMALLRDAGFREAMVSVVARPGISASAADAAKGLVEGNPVIVEINQRAGADVHRIEAALAAAIASRCGDRPVRSKLQALVYTARR